MSEFHDAVSSLLEALEKGLSIIKAQKKRRPKDQASSKKTPEAHLSRSLKKNHAEVKKIYSRDLARFGAGFAAGDAEAHSSISRILTRLSTGFLSIIERFTKVGSTSSDYQVLLNLSNTTRNETIQTFDQLSKRLSSSSLALAPGKQSSDTRHSRNGHRYKTKKSTVQHTRTKNSPDVSVTRNGWVRPKSNKNRSSDSKSPRTTETKRKAAAVPPKAPLPAPQTLLTYPSGPYPISPPHPPHLSRRETRKSIMSFASDSTKLGEIPEHKWTRPPIVYETGGFDGAGFPVTTYYPLQPYQEPVKPRSRFMRMFRK
ncbi:hypothetical protein LHYA1_G008768 [Lachnellula hyalina]|uniref:Uncharacterized protein n=1 Tax=Lachnellula hyalina TaxID=1316788 RepID=A0A8H8QWD8_9HELO|nr:uncharacterized protein LHYA1_G008768 [Lachnellula hyalina]TVY22594.1 hypothetical protein LHYA1_G008768 [Lachnellula hyalina]